LIRNVSTSAYIAEFVDLWYDRLDHVNFGSIKRFKHMKLISAVNVDNFTKYSV